MLSIIIPALNEEKYLPSLLNSIKRQDFSNYEIILADAGSRDKTVEIAKKYGCLVIKGGLPAKGRNEGAKVAKGDTLFFIDSDAVVPDGFFDKAISEFKERKLNLASFRLTLIPKKKISSLLISLFYNFPMVLLQNVLAHAAMGILVKKKLFIETGGFDESIKLAEDHYFARCAIKNFKAKFGVLKSVKLMVSDRRFKTDGWFSTGFKFFLCEIYMIFAGPVRSDIFKYKFGHYKEK